MKQEQKTKELTLEKDQVKYSSYIKSKCIQYIPTYDLNEKIRKLIWPTTINKNRNFTQQPDFKKTQGRQPANPLKYGFFTSNSL